MNIEVPAEDEDVINIVLLPNREDIGPNCLICEELIKTAEKNFKVNASKVNFPQIYEKFISLFIYFVCDLQEEIKQALEKSCDKLKSTFRSKCHVYVDKYGDKMAEMIVLELQPKVICTNLGICLFSEQEDCELLRY